MKRIFAVLMAIMLVVLSTVCASAAENSYGGLNGFFKSSRSDFAGKGGLTKEVQQLVSFDDLNMLSGGAFNIKPGSDIDRQNYKEGTGSYKATLSGGTYNEKPSEMVYQKHSVFSGTPGFNVSVTDVNAQSIGMWFYVDEVNNISCDHDKVYDTHQEDCATIYFKIGQSEYNYQQWNHTLYGSGWRYVEFAFATRENTPKQIRNNIQYDNLKYMQLILHTKGKEVTINVDDISLVTYKTTTPTPEAPNNGRWISAGDYDVLDGATVTEWMGVYYDTEIKTQGSSSLMIHGRKEHVDFRETIGGFKDFVIDVSKDVFCADIYIEDEYTAGSDWTIAFYNTSQEEQSIHADYTHIRKYVKEGTLQEGWNTVQIPFKFMSKSNSFSNGFNLHRVKIFIAGGDEVEFYNVAFDNMYIAKAEDLGIALEYVPKEEDIELNSNADFTLSDEKIAEIVASIANGETTKIASYSDEDITKIKAKLAADYPDLEVTFNEDGTVTVSKKVNLILIAVIGLAVLTVIVVVVIIIVLMKKKKAAAPAPEKKTETKEEKTEEVKDEKSE